MLTNLNCYFNLFSVYPFVFCPLRNRGGRNQDAVVFATLFCSFMSWDPCFLSSDTHWMYMNAHKSKLLFKPSFLSIHLFLSINRLRLDSSPLGFLTTFFVQNLNFSKSFHVNPKLEFTKLFWTCKMTNTRRFYNCTFTLLNRESV